MIKMFRQRTSIREFFNFYNISLIPELLVFAALLLFPLIYEIYLAFVTPEGIFTTEYVAETIEDPVYQWSLIRTVIYIAIDITLKFVIGFLAAAAFKGEFRGRGILMTISLLPWVVPLLPALYAWMILYNPDYGVINYVLQRMKILDKSYAFLGDPQHALYWIIWAHAWRYTPMWMTIILAGLYAIPDDYYDSAKVDGATPFMTFTRITIPMIGRYLLMNAVLSLIWTTGEFASVWVMTRGGPGTATHIVGTYAYWQLFFLGNTARAAASLILSLPLILTLMYIFLRLLGGGTRE